MKFGRIAVADGAGAILAHAVRRPGLTLKKGEVVGPDELCALLSAGIETIIAAQLEPGDVHENEAARQLASDLAGPRVTLERPFTGRCNLLAAADGLVVVDGATIDAVNAVDEAITVATLPPYRPVVAGEMIATVKIIPFSVPDASLARARAGAARPALSVAPYLPLRVGVVSTLLPGLKSSVIAKTLAVLEARLAPARARLVAEERVRHEVAELVPAILRVALEADLLVVFGASAITDRRDVVPNAIEAAGGTVDHLGMPVDPGNLLLLGSLPVLQKCAIPVIGAPGCARSPKENGFDFVLRRFLAGLPVTGADLRGMGVGGLLSEIVSRPQPREGGDG